MNPYKYIREPKEPIDILQENKGALGTHNRFKKMQRALGSHIKNPFIQKKNVGS